jgi:hypothetical protein
LEILPFPREQQGKVAPWEREVTLAPQGLLESRDCLAQLEKKEQRSARGRQRGAWGWGLGMLKGNNHLDLRDQKSLPYLEAWVWLITSFPFRVTLVLLGLLGRLVQLV